MSQLLHLFYSIEFSDAEKVQIYHHIDTPFRMRPGVTLFEAFAESKLGIFFRTPLQFDVWPNNFTQKLHGSAGKLFVGPNLIAWNKDLSDIEPFYYDEEAHKIEYVLEEVHPDFIRLEDV